MFAFTRYLLTPCLLLLFTLAACRKDKDDPLPAPGSKNDLPHYLLKSIAWDNGMQALCQYNDDSTISNLAFSMGSAGGQVVYRWQDGRLSEMYDSRSLYTNRFVYDDKGRLAAINHASRNGQQKVTYTLEYSYAANNQLQTLKYYSVNEAGKQLKETTTYQYSANGYPEKVVTASGNNTITLRIESWSDRTGFDYAHFLSTSLTEHYTLYNYPFLSTLDRLPAKVTELVKTGAGPERVEQLTETDYTITNFRLDKTITRMTYPGHPDLNQQQEAVYSYY